MRLLIKFDSRTYEWYFIYTEYIQTLYRYHFLKKMKRIIYIYICYQIQKNQQIVITKILNNDLSTDNLKYLKNSKFRHDNSSDSKIHQIEPTNSLRKQIKKSIENLNSNLKREIYREKRKKYHYNNKAPKLESSLSVRTALVIKSSQIFPRADRKVQRWRPFGQKVSP